MRIGLFLPNWIGDAVMATPTIQSIREEFSSAELISISRPAIADLLAGLEWIDETILYDPKGKNPHHRGWKLAKRLRKKQLDCAVLFPNSLRSGWMAFLSAAKQRVGMNRNGRGLLLTDPLKPKPRAVPHPVLQEYLRLAETLGCTTLHRNMQLCVTRADKTMFTRVKEKLGLTPDEPYICLNPGAAFGSAKHWPLTSFSELALQWVKQNPSKVLVLCGPSERSLAKEIVAQCGHPQIVGMADQRINLGTTKAAIESCKLLITTDSGPRHFAPCFNVPVVTLFGPTHIEWSETEYENEVKLQEKLECGPCQKRVCPLRDMSLHHQCMKKLSVHRVLEAALSLYPSKQSQTGENNSTSPKRHSRAA